MNGGSRQRKYNLPQFSINSDETKMARDHGELFFFKVSWINPQDIGCRTEVFQ